MAKQDSFILMQRIGKSLMLPVSVLPIAGILLGIGSANWGDVPQLVAQILEVMKFAGDSVFMALPLIFAIGVALGFTDNDGVAALAATVGLVVVLATMGVLASAHNEALIAATCQQLTGELRNSLLVLNSRCTYETLSLLRLLGPEVVVVRNVLGFTTVDTGVLSGISIGGIAAFLFNRYHQIALPEYLGFFGGKRFIPLITVVAAVLLGAALFVIWPPIGLAINRFSHWAAEQNPALAFATYGFIERALIPIGLQHIWNVPFFFEVGNACTVDGTVISVVHDKWSCIAQGGDWISGELRRFFSGDPNAGNLAGGYLFKMWGLPAAALAIWHSAHPSQRAKVGGIMISAALTAVLTGITEPIEFSFMFVAPLLYVFHALLAGLAYPLCILLEMKHGPTFSHGAIDFFLGAKLANNLGYFFVVGPLYAIAYYLVFRLTISQLHLATPGREAEQVRATGVKAAISAPHAVLEALGGSDNISNLDACITRLRVGVKEIDKVNREQLRTLGAAGVVIIGNAVQAVFGAASDQIRNNLAAYLQRQGRQPLPAAIHAEPALTPPPPNDDALARAERCIAILGGSANIERVLACATSRVRINLHRPLGQEPDFGNGTGVRDIMRIHERLYHLLVTEDAERLALAIQQLKNQHESQPPSVR